MQIARRTDFQPHFRTESQIRRSRQFRTADFRFRPFFKPQGRKLREFYPVQCDFIKPAAVKIRRNIAQIGKIRRCAALKRQGPIILHIPAIQLKRLQAAEIQPRKSVAVHSGRQADFCPVAKTSPARSFPSTPSISTLPALVTSVCGCRWHSVILTLLPSPNFGAIQGRKST